MRLDGHRMDISTYARYLRAIRDILEGRLETEIRPTSPGGFVASGCSVHDPAGSAPRAVVSVDCKVGPAGRRFST